jgi:hypothetical protein
MRVRRRLHGGPLGDERGAGMVEMAMVFPLLVLLVLGVFEFGMAWKSSLSVSNALRSGTRTIANAADNRDADYNGLVGLNAAMANVVGSEIEKVVVFDASTSGTVPTACTAETAVGTGGIDGVCNVYTGAQLAALDPADFDGECSLAPDQRWCPLDREASQAEGLDYVGVYVEVRHDFQTGLFGDGLTIKDTTIMRIEPQAV